MKQETQSCATPKASLARVAEIASRYKGREDMLIEVLRQVQEIAGNAIPEDVATVVANEMDVPKSKVYGVVSFYAMFSTEKRGKNIIRMCKSAPCHVRGAEEVLKAFEKALGISCGETTADGKFTLETCECLGICDRSPAVMVNDDVYGPLTPSTVLDVIKQYK